MEKILVVNNDMDTMTLLKSLLERKLYAVKFTGNQDEAMDLAADFRPDLIIIDILQREVIELLRKTETFNHIPIILMTGYNSTEKSIESAVEDVIKKPFDFELLEHKIRQQLGKTG